MDKERVLKLAEQADRRADNAMRNYQDTGISRYYTTYNQNTDLAEALRMAVYAADEHEQLVGIRSELATLASTANRIKQNRFLYGYYDHDAVGRLIESILAGARMRGLWSDL